MQPARVAAPRLTAEFGNHTLNGMTQPMKQVFLGASGLRVSELALGTMTFGREMSRADSFRAMDIFAERGGTFLDTANVYSNGLSEEIVGEWLAQQDRRRFIVATKVRFPMGSGPNDGGVSRKHILESVADSLRRLKTDYIDLYQVHCWDPYTPLEETLSTLDRLVTDGTVRYLGSSNYTGYQLERARTLQRQNGWEPFVCHQPQYNLLERGAEFEVLPVCADHGMGVIPWSPLRGGWLSGKYRREMGGAPEGTRIRQAEQEGWHETWARYDTERTWGIIDALIEIADRTGHEPAQVAINWLLRQPAVTAPIVGARTLSHLESNLGAAGWELSAEDVAQLTAVSEMAPLYPYDFVSELQHNR
jgi:aryl-alcohol dehydrogenase-like predicted oxidoreductase